ncbi:MAG TPA: LLM class flavin-dependent oxidoreductase [Thermodesulfobacteriota bacterium]|nr:LLM class flavin-dependent oxidoreductase [Thermodesulfobacteriota bacterium]
MIKIGIVIPYWSNTTNAGLIATARLAEELGYDSLWVPEMWGKDAFSILGLFAVHTKKIKLGTGIIPVFSRTPAIIAQTIATLDEISEGRIILGLGISGPIVIENWHGIKFEKPIERTKEYVEIIRIILSGDRANYEGEIFKLKDFRLQFNPLRKDIPIYIASLGTKNIRLTGEIADGWIPFLVPKEYIPEAKRELAAGAKVKGRDLDQITVCSYIPACISKDADLSKKLIQEHIAYYIGGMGTFYHNVMSRYGFRENADRILEAWKKGNKTQAILSVSDEMLDSIAILGTGEKGKRKIEEYRDVGVDLPVLIFPPKSSLDMIRETMIELAPIR